MVAAEKSLPSANRSEQCSSDRVRERDKKKRSTQIGPIRFEIGVIVDGQLVGTREVQIENSHATLQGSIDSLDGGSFCCIRGVKRAREKSHSHRAHWQSTERSDWRLHGHPRQRCWSPWRAMLEPADGISVQRSSRCVDASEDDETAKQREGGATDRGCSCKLMDGLSEMDERG